MAAKNKSFGIGDLTGETEEQKQAAQAEDVRVPTGAPPPSPTAAAEEFVSPAQQPTAPTAAPPPAPTASAQQFSAQPEATGQPPPAPTSEPGAFAPKTYGIGDLSGGTQAQPPQAQAQPPPAPDALLAAKQTAASYTGAPMPTREDTGEAERPTPEQIAAAHPTQVQVPGLRPPEEDRFDVRKHLGRLDETNPTASSSDNQHFEDIVSHYLSQYPTAAEIADARANNIISPEVANKAIERLTNQFANASPVDRSKMIETEKTAQKSINEGVSPIPYKDYSKEHWLWATQQSPPVRNETDPLNKGVQFVAGVLGIPYNEGNHQLVSSFLGSGVVTMMLTGGQSSKPLNPNDFDSMRELLAEQLKNGEMTADQWKERDAALVQAQDIIKRDPRNQALRAATGGGLGFIQDNPQRLAQLQKDQEQVTALVDKALPQWKTLRQQQAATEVGLAWKDLYPRLISGEFSQRLFRGLGQQGVVPGAKTPYEALHPETIGKDQTGGDRTFLEKTPQEQLATMEAQTKAVQETKDKLTVGPDTNAMVKSVLEHNATPVQSQEFLKTFHMDPKEGAVTSLTPLVLATAENLVATIGMPWEEACMRAYAKIVAPVAGGMDKAGAWMERFGGKMITSKAMHKVQTFVLGAATSHAAIALGMNQGDWDKAKDTFLDDAKWIAAELAVGAGIYTVGRFGLRGGADVLAGSSPHVRIPLRRGAAQAVSYGLEGMGAKAAPKVAAGEPWLPKVEAFPYRTAQNIVSQALSRTTEQYVRGTIRTAPLAFPQLATGNWQNFLQQVNQGGLTNALMTTHENVFNSFRGSVWDPIYTYKGDKPGKITMPAQVMHGNDPVLGNLDSTVTGSLKRMDESRRATALNLQNFASKWADVRYLPDAEFDRADQAYNGAVTGAKGFIAKPAVPGQKMQMFIRESQFDAAAPHEYGHMLQTLLHPHDQAVARYVAMKMNGRSGLNAAAKNYANQASQGAVTDMDYGSLPTNAEVTPGNPAFDPAKKAASQRMGNLTQERLLDEITADTLGQLAAGNLHGQAQNQPRSVLRNLGYLSGSIAERLGLSTTTPDVNGPLGFKKGVIPAKIFHDYLIAVSQHKIPASGAAPGQLNLKALSEIPGPPLQVPKIVSTGAKAIGAAVWSPYFGHSTSLMPAGAPGGPPLVSPGTPGTFQQTDLPPQTQQPDQETKGFQQSDLAAQQPPAGKPPPEKQLFTQSDLEQPPPKPQPPPAQQGAPPAQKETYTPPAPHIELHWPGPTGSKPETELQPPPANTPPDKELPPADHQVQKVTATEFGAIDTAAARQHPEKYPSGNKGYPAFGTVDLGNKNQDGVSLPPEDIVKQLGPVMKQDSDGVWHADPQFADDVKSHKIMIEVTNPANGRKAMVPLVDIGPAKKTGVGLDVLYKTARDLGFESGKTTLHYRIAGGHTAEASEAPEVIKPQHLVDAAVSNVGKLNTTQDAGTNGGELACADAVSRIVRDQLHINLPRTNSTAELYENLKNDTTGWKEVDPNTPGAVIVSPTAGGRHGHTGIVGKNGKIYSNSSANGNWGQNYTVDSWTKSFGDLGVHAFIPTDQVGRIKPGEEGEVAKEAGGAAGRRRGGKPNIFMGMGDTETAVAPGGPAGGEIAPLWKGTGGAAAAAGAAGIQPVHWPTGAVQETPEENVGRAGGGGYFQGGGGMTAGGGAGGGYQIPAGGGGGGGYAGPGGTTAYMPGGLKGGFGRYTRPGAVGAPEEEEEGESTAGIPNPAPHLITPHIKSGNLQEAQKAHALTLSPGDTRVRKQPDNYFKGTHFQGGDMLHEHLLQNLPPEERQVLNKAQQAIASNQPMHISYASAPKEGLVEEAPTVKSRQIEYAMSSPQARLLKQTRAQIAGHSFIPTAVGLSLGKKKGDPHSGYIQGISTNAAANNHHHLNKEMAAMGQASPYPKLDQKFANDLEGYVHNLTHGFRGTGEPAPGTDEFPARVTPGRRPYQLAPHEAHFLNAVINNQGARSKNAEGIRELARRAGTLINEEGETNPLRHAINTRNAREGGRRWSDEILEPTIRTFKAGLVHGLHENLEDIPEGIRPGEEFKDLTEALHRAAPHTGPWNRPDVPMAAAFMPGKLSPRMELARNKALNQIERDFSEGKHGVGEAKERLANLGENPDRYRFLEEHGMITPHEGNPEALTPEEHAQLTNNLRQQWISGKLKTNEYRERIAEIPLPEKAPGQTPAPSTTAYMPFAGPRARGFKQAKERGFTFKSPLEPEGPERFEISDEDMKFKPPPEGSEHATNLEHEYHENPRGTGAMDLSDAIDHPELFRNYPHLNRMTTRLDPTIKGEGYYAHPYIDSRGNEAGNELVLRTPNKETAAHEIQHAVQFHEQFAGQGSSPQQMLRQLAQSPEFAEHLADLAVNENVRPEEIPTWGTNRARAIARAMYAHDPGEIEARTVGRRAVNPKAAMLPPEAGLHIEQQVTKSAYPEGSPDVAGELSRRMREEAKGGEFGGLSQAAFMPGGKKSKKAPEPPAPISDKTQAQLGERPTNAKQAALWDKVAARLDTQHADAIQLEPDRDEKGNFKLEGPKEKQNPKYKKTDYNLANAPMLQKLGKHLGTTFNPRTGKDAYAKAPEETEDDIDKLDPEKRLTPFLNPTERLRVAHLNDISAVDAYADKLHGMYKSIEHLPEVMGGKDWYDDAVGLLRKHFGSHADLVANLLGATSAGNKVKINYHMAMDAYHQYLRGHYDDAIKLYKQAHSIRGSGKNALVKHIIDNKIHEGLGEDAPTKDTEAMDQWIRHHNLTPKSSGDKLFGHNSLHVLKVLAHTWEQEAGGPKTPNFAGNLSGRSIQATIDMWAARTMRRLGYEGHTDQPWRIQPAGEPGVNNVDFGLSQLAFRKAADRIGIKPSSLQAILWFAEQKHWQKHGWEQEQDPSERDYRPMLEAYQRPEDISARQAKKAHPSVPEYLARTQAETAKAA